MSKNSKDLNAMLRAIDITCQRAEEKEGAEGLITIKAVHLRYLLNLNKLNKKLLETCKAASSALKSYLHSNVTPALAEYTSKQCDEVIAMVEGEGVAK